MALKIKLRFQEREALKRKQAEEVQFLKRNNQQLKQQLEGIVQSKKWSLCSHLFSYHIFYLYKG